MLHTSIVGNRPGRLCGQPPQPLTTANLPTKKIDKHTWRARVDARASYRLRPKAAPDYRGARRRLWPAAGTHPTVACPVKRRSLGRTRRIRGIAAQSLLLSFQVAHANHRELASWLDTLQTDGLPTRRRPSNRHKLKNPHDWTPKGYLPGSTPEA